MSRRNEQKPLYWYYGSGSVAFGIYNNATSYLLLTYATQVLDIPGYLAGTALAIAMAWDAVSDLLVGQWSDKTQSSLGRRHPFMYASLVLLPLSFYALFNPVVELTEANSWWYLLATAILLRTAFTLWEVPSIAQLPDLVKDYDERSRWLALRYTIGWYGGQSFHVINLAFWVGAAGIAVQSGYSIYGLIGALIITASILVSSLGTQKAAARLPPPAEPFRIGEIWQELKQIRQSFTNPNFFWLFVYSLIGGAAAGLSNALWLYVVSYFFAFTASQIAISGLFVFAAPVTAYFLAQRLGERFGKKRTAITASLGAICLFPIPYILALTGLWPPLASTASMVLYSVFNTIEIIGFIIGGGVMLDSMMADVVEDSEIKTSRRSEGLFYAARNFASKSISAIGIVLAGSIVTLVGMDNISTASDMTDSMRVDLMSLFLPLYCGLYFLAIFMISKYRIDRNAHNKNLAMLATKA